MPKKVNLRAVLLLVHGALALILGLILFYLHAVMTNVLFEAVAIASAVVFAGTALLLVAIADWIAAILSGARKGIHQAWLYALAGLAAAVIVAGALERSQIALYLLLILAAGHAAITGAYVLRLAIRMRSPGIERAILFVLAGASAVMAILIGVLGWGFSEPTATAWLGACLCLAAAKSLFLSEMTWNEEAAAS
jgi:hypothetical protein